MSYLVVAYPNIAATDFDWIQQYRRKHDPRYFEVVKPHFTIVFAIHDVGRQEFVDEARTQLADQKPIDFELNLATVNFDDSKTYYHEFLVPERGYASLVKLHDKLYAGRFARYLNLISTTFPMWASAIPTARLNPRKESMR